MRLTISYNPYFLESSFLIDGESAADKSWATYLHRRHLQTWFYSAPNWRGMAVELEEALNEDKVDVEFEGRALDYRDLELYFTDWNQKEERRTTFHLLPQQKFLREEQNILQMLDELVSTFKDSPVEAMREPELMERYRQARSADFEMAVVATMSSGKSTLINALLGQDLLPSANDATTAKISRFCDVDGTDGFSVSCRDKDENVVHEETAATPELLQEYNEDKDVFYVDLKGDIPSISNEALRLRLIDTPGPNNHATDEHHDATYRFIQNNEQQPIILYVLDATKPETKSDAILLKDIATEIKNGGRQTQERFVFVMNRTDELDEKKDGTVCEVVKRRQNYLHNLDIEAAQIIPICARAAKLLRMRHNGQDLSRKEELALAYALENKLDQDALLSPSCKDKLERMKQEAQEQDDQYTLDLISTGIIGLELTINEYLEKYAYPYKISQIVSTFNLRLKEKLEDKKFIEHIARGEEELKEAKDQFNEVRKKKEELVQKRDYIKGMTDEVEFDPKFLINKREELYTKLTNILKGYCQVHGTELPFGQLDHFLAEVRTQQGNILKDAQKEMQSQLKAKIEKDFASVYNAYHKFFVDVQNIRIMDISFRNLEDICKMENVMQLMYRQHFDIINNDAISFEKKHTKEYKRKNPMREGFLGFFKVWEPWNITDKVEVSEGKFVELIALFGKLNQATDSNLQNQFSQIEIVVQCMYRHEKEKCQELLARLDEIIDTKLAEIQALTKDVENKTVDLDFNKQCKEWIEQTLEQLNTVSKF